MYIYRPTRTVYSQLWITVCEADWIELLMNVNTHEVVRDVTGPYMVLVGCIVRPPRTPVATVDLSGERVFHADV